MADDPSESPGSEPPSPEMHRQTIVLAAILIEGGLAFLATLLGWMVGQPPVEGLFWTTAGALWGIAAAVPLIAAFFVLHTWPVGPLRRIRRFGDEVIRPLLAPCTTMDLVGISLLAGVGEEMLFRGVLQAGGVRWFGSVPAAVAVASLVFGLLHAITLTYALLAALAGAYLGLVWLATDNLLVPIVAHALYDFVVLLWLLRGPGSQTPAPDAKPEELEEMAARQN
jgi:membrane protease YdiL (CAAX protease family)